MSCVRSGQGAEGDNEIIRPYDNETYSRIVMLTQPIPADVDYMTQRSVALPAPASTPTTGS